MKMIAYLLLIPSSLYAGILDSYQSVIILVHGLFANICFFAGGVMLVSSLAQFKCHRDNPSEVKLKVPVILLLLGAILLALSYFPSPLGD